MASDANTRLLNAAQAGDLDAVKTALANGANIEAVTLWDGLTALMYAASNGRDQALNVLLSKGANVNTQNNNGRTALMIAAAWGYKRAVEVLLSNGADISIKSKDGETALDLAKKRRFPGPGIDHHTVIKILSNPPAATPAANLKISQPTSSRVSHPIASTPYTPPPPSARDGLSTSIHSRIRQPKTATPYTPPLPIARDGLSTSIHSQIGQPKTVPSSEMDTIKRYNSHLQAENNELTALNSKLQADLQRQLDTTDKLQADLQRQLDTADKLQADLQRERDTTGSLQAHMQRQRDTTDKLQADLQRERNTADKLQADLQRECNTVSNLQAHLQNERDTTGMVQSLLQEKDHLLRIQHNQNQQQVQQLEADNRRLVDQIQDLQSRLTESTAEVNEFRFTRIQIPHPDQDSWNVPRHDIDIQMNLGEGAWGSVHKGVFRGQQVAVKLIHTEILQKYTIDQMKREIRVMSHIQHPNLVRLIAAVVDCEVEQCTNSPLLILELLHSNLRTAYGERELSRNVLISIFRDVAYALHYLHEHQEPIIHRDVSAPNVLLEELSSGGWKAKLSDFGSANIARDCKTAAPGALVYSAPETYPPENPYDAPPKQTTKIDVFSYGYVIAEVIAKEMPAPEKRRQMLISIERLWRSMHKLIMECIRSKPEDRWTMTQVLHRLNSLPPQ